MTELKNVEQELGRFRTRLLVAAKRARGGRPDLVGSPPQDADGGAGGVIGWIDPTCVRVSIDASLKNDLATITI